MTERLLAVQQEFIRQLSLLLSEAWAYKQQDVTTVILEKIAQGLECDDTNEFITE